MGRNKDVDIARNYHLPVEMLRDGLPQMLREAPDDEERSGSLIRVSSASGLAAALAQKRPGLQPPLEVYLVAYIPPLEALTIRDMLEEQKEQKGCKGPRQDGAAAPRRRFFISNSHVLEAKEMSLMAIDGEISKIDLFAQKVRDNPDKYPHELEQLPSTDDDIGLKASMRFKDLKYSFFVARVLSGNTQEGRKILKQIDRAFYDSLFRSFHMTQEEQDQLTVEIATNYEMSLKLTGTSLNTTEIARKLLGLTSFADFEDRKRLIMPDSSTIGDRKVVLKRLKRQKQKFNKLRMMPTLIGAALPDFREKN